MRWEKCDKENARRLRDLPGVITGSANEEAKSRWAELLCNSTTYCEASQCLIISGAFYWRCSLTRLSHPTRKTTVEARQSGRKRYPESPDLADLSAGLKGTCTSIEDSSLRA